MKSDAVWHEACDSEAGEKRKEGSQAVEPAGAAVLHTLPLYAQPAAVITAI